MPIYKYECAECGHTFEDLASFSDPDPEACPSCQADAVTKLITGGNFILKGGGWYVTDYASPSGGSSAAGSGAVPADEGTSPAKVEAGGAASSAPPAPAGGAKPDGSKIA